MSPTIMDLLYHTVMHSGKILLFEVFSEKLFKQITLKEFSSNRSVKSQKYIEKISTYLNFIITG